MAVFTAIASAIVGTTLFGSALAATIVTSIVAAGLAIGTAKALGVMDPPKQQNAKDPGVKIQLPPSTDNRVPVFYGQSFTGGIIVDAEIKNQNNTMVYCMVIGEKTDSGTITINDIYRDDAKLNFATGSANVSSATDPNATNTTVIANKIRCRVFAGNAQSSVNQIFPTSNKVTAQSLMSTITSSTNYEGLVYSIIEMDYDAENGLQGLGAITYDINNSLNEPSNVLLDYLRNDRYGAGLSNADLDLNSFNDLYDYSNAQVAYTTAAGASATHDRWQVDGMLSTYQPVKVNINEICRSCQAYFAYDAKQGKFKVISNRAATVAEQANAYLFNDDNIVSSIEITSTELYSLYNSIDAEYPSVTKKDQTQTIVISTPSGDRNTNEPDNPLDTRFNLVNDRARVGNLANIDLRQARTSMVLNFTADYSAIVCDVGDVVKVTNSLYGFTNKLFRVMRVTEIETSDAMLGAKVMLLEYSDDIYTHDTIQSDGTVGLPNINNWWINWGNLDIANLIANINVVDNPATNKGNTHFANGTVQTANVDLANIHLPVMGGIGSSLFDVGVTIPANITADTIEVTTTNQDITNSTPQLNTVRSFDINAGDHFTPGETIRVPIISNQFGINTFYDIERRPAEGNIKASVRLKDSKTGAVSQTKESGNVFISPQGSVTPQQLRDVGVGVQIEDRPANNLSVQSSAVGANAVGTANTAISSNFDYDLIGIDEGDYSMISSAMLGGTNTGAFNVAFAHGGNVTYQERYAANNALQGNIITQDFGILGAGGVGIQIAGASQSPGPLVATEKINISNASAATVAAAAGASTTGKVYTPLKANVAMFGNTDIGTSGGSPRSFNNQKFDMIRLTKGDRFIGCFIAGSMVLMANGVWKEIEFVVIGEKVMGLNGVTNTVTKLHHHPVAQQVVYTIDNAISLTDTHPMLTVEGWKSFNPEGTTELHPDLELAGKLMIGDTLIKHDGETPLADYTKSVQDIPVYNLDVDGDDTYIVDGYVVHNK